MRTILVTGATGALGTHVTDLLRQSDDHVRTLSRHPDPTDPCPKAAVNSCTRADMDTLLTTL